MTFWADDLSGFFADFGVSATVDGRTATVIYDERPRQIAILGEPTQDAVAEIRMRTADAGDTKTNDAVLVASKTFKVAWREDDDTGLTFLGLKKP